MLSRYPCNGLDVQNTTSTSLWWHFANELFFFQRILLSCWRIGRLAIEQFNSVIRDQDLRMPNVVVTDNCRAMKNALTTIFPELPQSLCTWHISQLVQHRVRVTFNEALYEEGSDDYDNVKERRLQCSRDWLVSRSSVLILIAIIS